MLETIWEDALRCLPRIHIVEPDEAGVFVRLGRVRKKVESGAYFCWPFIDYIQALNIKPQIFKTDIQSMTTSDGRAIAVRCAVGYWIGDVEKALFEVQDFDDSLNGLVVAVMGTQINRKAYMDCIKIEGFNADNVVLSEIRKTAVDWGLRITKFWITDLVDHKVYRIIGGAEDSTMLAENEDD